MAGASMNGIKARIKSVESTMQITKAMELVATSKLRRAKESAERTRPYLDILGRAISDCLSSPELSGTAWSAPSSDKTLFVVIAGDRGLAGGYNSNVFRLTEALSAEGEACFLPIGKKSLEYFRSRKREIFSDRYEYAAECDVGDAVALGEELCRRFRAGEVGRVVLVYTKFVSMLTQAPTYTELLPLKQSEATGTMPEIESDPEELLDAIAPSYVGGVLISALRESLASESGARRSAMNAANKNAGEMIDSLMLKYNRARQAVITQEITEIVSGAEAL
ncbi:MAG: ATP synthase F1 subunit gamma [Clostridia bacterium]|nr:ATP synthase F1 subunit gamma [Clostridia bacterium]